MPLMLRHRVTSPRQSFTAMTLLLLMLWPAPIPIVHCHGDDALRVSDQQLVQHLVNHHGGFANAGEWPTQWHWHWVYTGDGYIGLTGEEVVSTGEQSISRPSFVLPELDGVNPIESLPLHRVGSLAQVIAHRGYTFQSVALMHSRQSLPELLGIMRL